MGLIEDFIGRYRREQDFYDQAARLVMQSLESKIQAEGIRAIVTYRAKNASRLEPKVRERDKAKHYTTVEQIYDDIVDLAGVRVALYFPAQREQVGHLIRELFLVGKEKLFPDLTATPAYKKRFSGYAATHYRVRLREATLADAQKRYGEAQVEIQVASVLMHAWAEVEHDLVYKPLQGELSIDEYAVLDELNGLVIAGELALERLQRAGETRVASGDRRFSNHYELATHILSEISKRGITIGKPDTELGRVDFLFEFLRRLQLLQSRELSPFLDALSDDFDGRAISEQIVDQLLIQDASRYTTWHEITGASDSAFGLTVPGGDKHTQQLIEFLTSWIELEHAMRAYSDKHSTKLKISQLGDLLELPPGWREGLESMRQMRNEVVHGMKVPKESQLSVAKSMIDAVVGRLQKLA